MAVVAINQQNIKVGEAALLAVVAINQRNFMHNGCLSAFTELQKTVASDTSFCCNILPRAAQEVSYAFASEILPASISSLIRRADGNCLIPYYSLPP